MDIEYRGEVGLTLKVGRTLVGESIPLSSVLVGDEVGDPPSSSLLSSSLPSFLPSLDSLSLDFLLRVTFLRVSGPAAVRAAMKPPSSDNDAVTTKHHIYFKFITPSLCFMIKVKIWKEKELLVIPWSFCLSEKEKKLY